MDTFCEICGKLIIGRSKGTKYCNRACAAEKARRKYRETNPKLIGIAPSAVGTISELTVAIDLTLKGYHVFKSICPCGPCDLAVLKEKNLLLIEVTSGYINAAGKLTYPPHKKYQNTYDILAVVEKNRKITYFPDLFC